MIALIANWVAPGRLNNFMPYSLRRGDGAFLLKEHPLILQLMPLYTRDEDTDDRQFYLMSILWLYSHGLRYIPCEACLRKWWEASLN